MQQAGSFSLDRTSVQSSHAEKPMRASRRALLRFMAQSAAELEGFKANAGSLVDYGTLGTGSYRRYAACYHVAAWTSLSPHVTADVRLRAQVSRILQVLVARCCKARELVTCVGKTLRTSRTLQGSGSKRPACL